MKITGTITLVSPLEQVGAKGTDKQTIVIETGKDTLLAIDFIGQNAANCSGLQKGDKVTVDVKISSREYNGKWYTGVNGFTVAIDEMDSPFV